MIKILNFFPKRHGEKVFEAELLRANLLQVKGDCEIEFLDKFRKDVDIANFFSVDNKNTAVIRECVEHSIPTLLWTFYANKDDQARIVEFKHGKPWISSSKLQTINMMDGVVVPSNEARGILRELHVKIPIFIVPSAVNNEFYANIDVDSNELFARYFRISEEQKYAISVMNLRTVTDLDKLEKIAKALPDYKFFCFISAKHSLANKIRLNRLDRFSAPNLIVSTIVAEDVYRSGLINARYFIEIGDEKTSTLTLGEPMFVGVPIIINRKAAFSDIVNEDNAFLVDDYEEIISLIKNDNDHDDILKKAKTDVGQDSFEQFVTTTCNLFMRIYLR